MGVRTDYFGDPRPSRRNLSQGLAFVAAILIFVLVAVGLYFGSSWGIVPPMGPADLVQTTNARSVVLPLPTLVPTPSLPALEPKVSLRLPERDPLALGSWIHSRSTTR
jgi:hypothetical protein